MTECTTGSHVAGMLGGFGLVFVLHAAPLACVFVRWGHRYYWGFLPATFSALVIVFGSEMDSPCAIIQTEFTSVMIAAVFYSISYLSLIFFKPGLHFGALFGEAHVPFVLVAPLVGALYASVWLLLSLGRDRLLMDTGETVTLKERLIETFVHGVLAVAVCVLAVPAISG